MICPTSSILVGTLLSMVFVMDWDAAAGSTNRLFTLYFVIDDIGKLTSPPHTQPCKPPRRPNHHQLPP
ncbi:hypothetical protein GJ744_002140 [Endocarpon pusillum]|uniref:Uncharacterized protein n=1 Tax=Endocarpon pusillum TaxID=364733 RepID=A0A8H7E0N2_9EURO|nr:hypothetical protein GJ744_002140 [Endocarpon pusillum]